MLMKLPAASGRGISLEIFFIRRKWRGTDPPAGGELCEANKTQEILRLTSTSSVLVAQDQFD
jgi:hypothetical protein